MDKNQANKPNEKIEKLIADLQDDDYITRQSAVETLGAMGAKASSAIPALIKALSDEEPEVASEARKALSDIGSLAIPALNDALLNGNSSVRYKAATALEAIGPESIVTLPNLLYSALLFSEDNYYDDYEKQEKDREASIAAWDAIAAFGPKVILTILEYAENVDEETCDEIIEFITSYSMYKHKDTIPTLINALKCENQFVRELASTILDKMRNHSQVIPSLIEVFEDENIDEDVRWLARLTLESIYPLSVQTEALLNDNPMDVDEKLEKLTETVEKSKTAAVREKAIWQLEDINRKNAS